MQPRKRPERWRWRVARANLLSIRSRPPRQRRRQPRNRQALAQPLSQFKVRRRRRKLGRRQRLSPRSRRPALPPRNGPRAKAHFSRSLGRSLPRNRRLRHKPRPRARSRLPLKMRQARRDSPRQRRRNNSIRRPPRLRRDISPSPVRAIGKRGRHRSHSPMRAACRARRDSRCACPRR